MKTITIKILKWLNEFRNEIKEINNSNRYNSFKTDTKILKEEQEHLKQEFNLYMDKMKIKHTKNLKNTFRLSVLINLLILISATFTILGFNLHDMAFQITTDISKGTIGISLIIGLILIQWLCFHAESIQTTIEQYFGRHIKGLNRIKYILIPISIIGTFNFLIDYITFTDIKIFNNLMVFMICVSIDYSILVFSGIRYDKKHLIFSKNSNNIVKDNKSILHMILFNLLGDKLLKIRLDYINKVNNYNTKLLQHNEPNVMNNVIEEVEEVKKTVNLDKKVRNECNDYSNEKPISLQKAITKTENSLHSKSNQCNEKNVMKKCNENNDSLQELITNINDYITQNYKCNEKIKVGDIKKKFGLKPNDRKWNDKIRDNLESCKVINGRLTRIEDKKDKIKLVK